MLKVCQKTGLNAAPWFRACFPWLICFLGALFYCYEYFLRITPSVMQGELTDLFHLNAAQFGNLSAYYYYAYTPMQLFVGILMDRYGPRRLLTIACLSCAIGTFMFAYQQAFVIVALGRFLVGFGSAFAFVGALKLATMSLPPDKFAMISGLTCALGMLGAVVGDISLMALVKSQGVYHTIMLSGFLGILLALILYAFITDHPLLDDAFMSGEDAHLRLRVEFFHLFSDLFKVVRRSRIWINGLISGLLFLPASAFAELWGVPFLNAYGFTPAQSAWGVSMVFIGWALGGPLTGWVSDRMRCRRWPISIGGFLAGAAVTFLVYMPHLSVVSMYILLFMFGLFSSVQVITFAIGREVSPSRIAGTALAFTNMLVMAFGALLQPLIGVLIDLGHPGSHAPIAIYHLSDYHRALLVLPVGIFLAALCTVFLKETHCRMLYD